MRLVRRDRLPADGAFAGLHIGQPVDQQKRRAVRHKPLQPLDVQDVASARCRLSFILVVRLHSLPAGQRHLFPAPFARGSRLHAHVVLPACKLAATPDIAAIRAPLPITA